MRGRLIIELEGEPAGFELARIHLAKPGHVRDAIGRAAEFVNLELLGCPVIVTDEGEPE